jgi:DNA-directed DNA polymerase III PolC
VTPVDFTHLNCHSYYSFLSGTASIAELIEEARRSGMKSLALTDTGGMYGAVEFYKAAKEAEIKPIIGAEIKADTQRVLLLAINREGFASISALVSRQQLEDGFSFNDSLRALASSRDAENIAFLADNAPLLKFIKESGARRICAEIVRAGKGGSSNETALIAAAKRMRIPLVATNNVHFIRSEDHGVHRALRAIGLRTSLSALKPADTVHHEHRFKTSVEMTCLFHDLPEALKNTSVLASECNVEFELGRPVFPLFEVPESETHYSYLCKLCFEGAARLYKPLTRTVMKRLSYELEVIDKLGFSPYFLIVWDIVRFARENCIPSVGRGSAADSIISYVLGITPVDPIKYNLYFERFLNLERADPPDIDIDFCWRRRQKVLRYVYEKYGYDKVAMIGTYYRFSFRAAIREIARVMGVPEGKISAFTKRLPYFSVRSVEEAVRVIPECRDLPLNEEPYRSVLAIAEKIQDFPRHMSTHPGGIVVAPRPITWYVPLQQGGSGLAITQYDMHGVEDTGLVKIDLLGQRGLTVVQDTVEAVKENYGIDIDFEKINPTKDLPTRNLIRRGDTLGCFYIESPAMRALEKKLRTDNYELMVAASSIIRPGVADSGMLDLYVRYHNKAEEVRYQHPLMKELLGDTYGIMIYQEDVIKVAHHIAGFTFGEADLLRRGMTKKRHWTNLNEYRSRFIRGAANRGIPEETAEQIWKQIESFSGYSFCKAHSAAYSVISFRSAYLRCHYPAEFMAAVLTNGGGFYSRPAYLEEARRMGLKIIPPHVNESEEHYTGRGRELRVALAQIKNLSRGAIRSALKSRSERGKFSSIEDFIIGTGVTRTDAEILVKAGALDNLGLNRSQLLWVLDAEYESIIGEYKARQGAQEATLFDNTFTFNARKPPALPDHSPDEKLRLEMEHLDMAVTAHPLTLFKEQITRIPHVFSPALPRFKGKTVTVIGWMVATKRAVTGKGEFMKFLTAEDEKGLVEAVIFPAVYRKYGHLLVTRGPFAITGKVDEEFGNLTLTVSKLELISYKPGIKFNNLYERADTQAFSDFSPILEGSL